MAERERALREEAAGIRAAIDAEHVRVCLTEEAMRRRVQGTTAGADFWQHDATVRDVST